MHATKSNSAQSGARNLPRSAAACAQLLELWVNGHFLADRATVEHCVFQLQQLDAQVADKYDCMFVNESDEDGEA